MTLPEIPIKILFVSAIQNLKTLCDKCVCLSENLTHISYPIIQRHVELYERNSRQITSFLPDLEIRDSQYGMKRERVRTAEKRKWERRQGQTAASLLICMLYISERMYLCFVLYRHETRAELLCCVPVTMMKDDEKDAWINVQSLQDRFYLSYKCSVSPPAWFQRLIR